MSNDRSDMNDGIADDASRPRARGPADDVRVDRLTAAAIDDFLTQDEARLGDELRSVIGMMARATIGAIEAALRQHSARLLGGRGEPGIATAIADGPAIIHDRLITAGAAADRPVLRELLARAREQQLAAALPSATAGRDLSGAAGGSERPSLLVRLAANPDGVIANAATAMLIADAHRRSISEPEAQQRSDLPAELQHRLVWRAAAVLRQEFADRAGNTIDTLDRALTEAAQRCLAAHDEGDRLESCAMRLASAMAISSEELGPMLAETLSDRRVALFTALLAHPLGLSYEAAREVLLDPVAERLWLALRALGLDRATIAGIGLALCEADPRRDVDAFADRLDAIMAIAPADARRALATLRLHPDFRAAVIALAQER